MAKPSLKLCFFWHMHQPDYRDSSGIMSMPWVFLHAIKDYYEMPWLLSLHKNLKATFNITSPLIEQLNLYAEPLKNDRFLSLWHKHPDELDENNKKWVIKTCKSTQYETMVRPLARFDMLYHKEILNNDEIIDLEVMFILAWCGNYLRQNNILVKKLFKKSKNFTQEDKESLLKELCDFIKTVLPFYKTLQDDGVISISTTPYNHPILPLLLDINNAKKADPHTVVPNNPISLKDDAIEQVKSAIKLYKKSFGKTPSGFWPAEGAVDEHSISIYKKHGIKWIATDEAILFNSLEENANRSKIYKTYSYNDINIGFRDHGISDLIGFNYRFKSAQEATTHFMHVIEPIGKDNKDATLFVILDGENAWEFFENNAYEFFMQLYQTLSKSSWCKTVTMDEVSGSKNIEKLPKLAPGSWINGNFNTWAGDPEKNRAWELIYQTRRDVENYHNPLEESVSKEIKKHFLAAECSDWFWWYGDDHVTEFAFEFDTLFREHLIRIYRLLKTEPPSDLFEPIITHKSSASFLLKPQTYISPLIDGKNSSFFEWLGSGSIDENRLYSTMDQVRGPVSKIYYGHNGKTVFLAFEGNIESLKLSELKLLVTIEESGKQLVFNMQNSYNNKNTKLAVDERIELALDCSIFKKYGKVHLRFEILKKSTIIQTMPGYGSLAINLDETYADNWFI